MEFGLLVLGLGLGGGAGWWLGRWRSPPPPPEVLPWAEMIQTLPYGCLVVDEENQLLLCNPAAQDLLCLQRWQPGQPRLLLELVRSYELDQLIERSRSQPTPCVAEWAFYPPPGESAPLPITLRATSQLLATGCVVVFLENRQPLVELTQARERWVTDLTHELKTPLTAMQLVAEALHQRLEPPLQTWVTRLLGELKRLIHLVHNWLEVAQGRSSVRNPTPVDLAALVQSVWQTLEPLAQRKDLTLDYGGPASFWLAGDELRLYRMLCNVLDNSIKYSPAGCPIRLTITPQEMPQRVAIDVIDQGPGFPPADLPYLFERFYQGQIHPQWHESGAGLGLAIVRQIVTAHGGEVRAANHPEGGGAWLHIQLPWTAAPLLAGGALPTQER
ncbi:histidine kinase [Gloeomargarita lithophora Alchichica-D10]|uniref:histidine kinase n=1 Tax=Gloeomargarita lithophora Alchichica-D10 TaxID=1188229 RepID=A0A1J0AD78_9CYAN|nr:PAS domain-containing sensor histidine kinase [Gloeomargarita lithophora]APB33863.1 histidine kinase [Gloeomargarita lithophora Alchichica-D10]